MQQALRPVLAAAMAWRVSLVDAVLHVLDVDQFRKLA
jgi:hypothetical protein